MCTHIYTHTHIHTHAHIHHYTHMHTCTCSHMDTHTYTCMHTHTHACAHMHTHTHTQAARSYGYTLISRSPGRCVILTPNGKQIEYEVLHLLEFDPVRKCMSVIVREKRDPRIILYSKGADSVIYSHLVHHSGLLLEDDGNVLVDNLTRAEATQEHLTIYAKLGLRTLCLAMRVSCMHLPPFTSVCMLIVYCFGTQL